VITLIAMAFMILLALINLRGVGESVKFNVILTLVEMTALFIVILIGFWALAQGDGDVSRITTFTNGTDRGMFLAVTLATSVAFFAMVGFEDSVNMVEECHEPQKIFPRTMLTGLGIAVIIYMLVAVAVVAVLTPGELETINESEGRALLEVVSKGAPDFPIDRLFPFLAVFAVANTALINMMMASRLLYGLAKQDVLPRSLASVSPRTRAPYMGILFSTLLALGLIWFVANRSDSPIVTQLSGTTALLLLGVFTVVNVACLVLRREPRSGFFRSPGPTPVLAALLCLALIIIPWGERDPLQYKIAAAMLGIGVVLWLFTWLTNRSVRAKKTGFRDIEHLGE
jgi:APA family basic amino acid/polyamine antiporter